MIVKGIPCTSIHTKNVHMVVQYFASNLCLICSLRMMSFSKSKKEKLLYEENFPSAIILEIDVALSHLPVTSSGNW